MNWEQKYLENLEYQLRDIKDELRSSESRTLEAIRDAMKKIYIQTDQRHREYLAVSEGMGDLMKHIDKKQSDLNKWISRAAVSVILGVASLVSAGVFGMAKLVSFIPGH